MKPRFLAILCSVCGAIAGGWSVITFRPTKDVSLTELRNESILRAWTAKSLFEARHDDEKAAQICFEALAAYLTEIDAVLAQPDMRPSMRNVIESERKATLEFLAAHPELKNLESKKEADFSFSFPASWQKAWVLGRDSRVGRYNSDGAYLEYDEVFGLGWSVKESAARISELRRIEANPKLLEKGREVWRVDGRLAEFVAGEVNPKIYGRREHRHVARLFVPYEGRPGYLEVVVFHRHHSQTSSVRQLLQSIKWRSPEPNKAPEPTPGSVTPRAQESKLE